MLVRKFSLFLIYLLLIKFINIFSNPIIEISIPKAGTYLLSKCLNLLTYKEFKNLNVNINNINSLSKTCFFHAHLEYNEANVKLIRSLRPIGFFVLRDPRDQVISLMHWIYKLPDEFPNYFYLNPDELLCRLIRETKKLYLSYVGWMKEPNFITVRFEHLVGPNGYGNKKRQVNEILTIARHMKFFASNYRAGYIAENLFGNTFTFRQGKIGSWKEHFTQKHIRLFKQHAGQLLINLKYEKDLNW